MISNIIHLVFESVCRVSSKTTIEGSLFCSQGPVYLATVVGGSRAGFHPACVASPFFLHISSVVRKNIPWVFQGSDEASSTSDVGVLAAAGEAVHMFKVCLRTLEQKTSILSGLGASD